MKQHFKGVIWPRGEFKTGKRKVYRYPIVGMLVTDQPIPEFEGKNEIVLDGASSEVALALANIKGRDPKYRTGDATNVMLHLNEL